MKNYKIELIKNFYTLIHELPDGRTLAAIILPSEMEYPYSASCVKVMADGKLIRHKNFTKFIKPSTYYEITDPEFRKACRKNMHVIKNATPADKSKYYVENDILSGKRVYYLRTVLTDWFYEAASKYDVIRLFFGGDLFCGTIKSKTTNIIRVINDILNAETKEKPYNEDVQVIIRTCDACSLDSCMQLMERAYKKLHPNLHLVCDAQSYGDMSLYCTNKITYHWAQENVEGAIDDLDAIPEASNNAAYFKAGIAVCIPEEAYDIFHSTEAQ